MTQCRSHGSVSSSASQGASIGVTPQRAKIRRAEWAIWRRTPFSERQGRPGPEPQCGQETWTGVTGKCVL